ncbi:MAG: tRNA 2-selenouridine(34) synthase MnmH [Chitinophagaceae bacterium]|nr:MAG: tRNA 2-selenouridine(34) synthase MnmH [Chitinophagaceae bacterium]
MAIKKISIDELLRDFASVPVFDVRSPGEYSHAHIPGSVNLPLFTDEERKKVGTLYKQEGKQRAIKEGLDYFGPKMREMVEEVEALIKRSNEYATSGEKHLVVHCWRGGMRSAAVAWLLDMYGFNVHVLSGGYKAFRNRVLSLFKKDYNCTILGGFTGSGKTAILHELRRRGKQVVDLEGLANHKGSAFGGIGQPAQPSQEMFENLLGMDLYIKEQQHFYLEDESQRIGVLHIPHTFWKMMRSKPICFVDVDFNYRLQNILHEYGHFEKDKLLTSIERIQKRLGPLETKNAIAHIHKDEIEACFSILLYYYDKVYNKALQNRENLVGLLNKIPCFNVDTKANTDKLLLCNSVTP